MGPAEDVVDEDSMAARTGGQARGFSRVPHHETKSVACAGCVAPLPGIDRRREHRHRQLLDRDLHVPEHGVATVPCDEPYRVGLAARRSVAGLMQLDVMALKPLRMLLE